jgi:hypothetical protein
MRNFISTAPVGFFPLIMLTVLLFIMAGLQFVEESSTAITSEPEPTPHAADPASFYPDDDASDDEPAPGYAEAIPPEEAPPGPEADDLMSIADIEYERDADRITALISLDTNGINPEWGNELDVQWSDGESTTETPSRVIINKGIIEISAERSGVADDVSVDALFFERVTYDLEHDPDATVHEDRIETRWGDFPVLNIIERDDGSARVDYAAVGRRVIYRSSMDHFGEMINFATVAYARTQDLIPVDMQLGFSRGFVEARPDLPLPAEVQVREIAGDVTVDAD